MLNVNFVMVVWNFGHLLLIRSAVDVSGVFNGTGHEYFHKKLSFFLKNIFLFSSVLFVLGNFLQNSS